MQLSRDMSDIKIILCGLGGVGRNVTRLLSRRQGYRIVAGYTRNPKLVGQDLGVLAGIGPSGILATDRETALSAPADLLLVATTSFLRMVADDLNAGLAHGLDVITTAEEAAFPWIIDRELAEDLNQRAKERGKSLIGLGLNPGFIFDALLLTATGIAWDVRAIHVRRVVDISRFSETIQRRLGIGHSEAEFHAGVKSGSITGHIGFPQSFHLAARCLGQPVERIEKSFEPLIAGRRFVKDHVVVEAGTTAGFIQRCAAIVHQEPWMDAEFIAHVEPQAAGYLPEDSISIEGYNSVNLKLNPGCQPQLGTAGIIANSIPRVIAAPPGFITVADLAIPFARKTVGSFH